jgi:hypothetical protein
MSVGFKHILLGTGRLPAGATQCASSARMARRAVPLPSLHFLQAFAYGLEHHTRMGSGQFLPTEQ